MPTFVPTGKHVGAVYQPLVAICHDLHLIMDAFENQMGDNAVDDAFLGFDEIHILGTDHDVHRAVLAEAGVHAGEI